MFEPFRWGSLAMHWLHNGDESSDGFRRPGWILLVVFALFVLGLEAILL
jgi:hypothetical protein